MLDAASLSSSQDGKLFLKKCFDPAEFAFSPHSFKKQNQALMVYELFERWQPSLLLVPAGRFGHADGRIRVLGGPAKGL